MTANPMLADAAARYAAAGWPVHPLHDTTSGHCSCRQGPDCRQPGKHPRTTDGFHDATTRAETVSRWWRRWPHANIGVPTGQASRLAVIDLDGPAGAATWHALTTDHGDTATATATTPHGGHRWYLLRDGLVVPRSIRGLGAGIDVLGNDGYAIAPPSTITVCPKPHEPGTACGTRYAWTSATRRIAALPTWLPHHLHDGRHHTSDPHTVDQSCQARPGATDSRSHLNSQRVRHPRRYALAALRGEAERVATAPAGQRNDTLNYAAWRLAPHLHGGDLTETEWSAPHFPDSCYK